MVGEVRGKHHFLRNLPHRPALCIGLVTKIGDHSVDHLVHPANSLVVNKLDRISVFRQHQHKLKHGKKNGKSKGGWFKGVLNKCKICTLPVRSESRHNLFLSIDWPCVLDKMDINK